MTYRKDFTLPREITELVNYNGFVILPELLRLVFNSARQVERETYLGAAPYQRSPERRGHANGFKPKTVQTRVGDIRFDIPQVREGNFYPSALEIGWVPSSWQNSINSPVPNWLVSIECHASSRRAGRALRVRRRRAK